MIQSHQWRGFSLDLCLLVICLFGFFTLTCPLNKHDYFMYSLKCFGKELDNGLMRSGGFLEHGKYQADNDLCISLESRQDMHGFQWYF